MIGTRGNLRDVRKAEMELDAQIDALAVGCLPEHSDLNPRCLTEYEAKIHRPAPVEARTYTSALGRWRTLSTWWFHSAAELATIFPETACFVTAMERSRREASPADTDRSVVRAA
jgi:hypothetical protein